MTKKSQAKKLKRSKRVRKALNMIQNNTPKSGVMAKLVAFDERRHNKAKRA